MEEYGTGNGIVRIPLDICHECVRSHHECDGGRKKKKIRMHIDEERVVEMSNLSLIM